MRFFLRHSLPPLLLLAIAIFALDLAARHYNKPYLLPRPIAIYRVFVPAETDPVLLQDAKDLRHNLLHAFLGTTKGALLGFALSAASGFVLAAALASSVWLRRAVYPYTLFFQTVPIIAIAPLLVIWLDYGLPVVIAAAFIASVFPVIANTLTGLTSTDPLHNDLFRLYRASLLQHLFKLKLPTALPHILTGLRISAGLAVIGAIVGEFVSSGSLDSLGAVIDFARTQQRTDLVFAAVLLASLLGLALFSALNLATHLLLKNWHPSTRN